MTAGIVEYPASVGGTGGGVTLPIAQSDVTNLVTDLLATVNAAGAGLTKSGQSLGLDAQSITPGTYGAASQVPVITFNDRGIATGVSLVTVLATPSAYLVNGSSGITSMRMQQGTTTWDLTVGADGALTTTVVSTGGTGITWEDGTASTWEDGSAMNWEN